jgi:CheY-like chemotaxis protein
MRAMADAPRAKRPILVVDDDVFARAFFEAALTAAGYPIAIATSVDEGLQIWAQQPFEVVIVDIFMPERSGLELIRALRRRSTSTRIIAITGGGSGEGFDVLATAKDVGADITLRKPVPAHVLIEAVESLLVEPS